MKGTIDLQDTEFHGRQVRRPVREVARWSANGDSPAEESQRSTVETRTDPKSNPKFKGMMDAASWRGTDVHKATRWYGCVWCGQKFDDPHAVYAHLDKTDHAHHEDADGRHLDRGRDLDHGRDSRSSTGSTSSRERSTITMKKAVRSVELYGTEGVYEVMEAEPGWTFENLGRLAMQMRRVDPKWKLTPDQRDRLVGALLPTGMKMEKIATMAGISRTTVSKARRNAASDVHSGRSGHNGSDPADVHGRGAHTQDNHNPRRVK